MVAKGSTPPPLQSAAPAQRPIHRNTRARRARRVKCGEHITQRAQYLPTRGHGAVRGAPLRSQKAIFYDIRNKFTTRVQSATRVSTRRAPPAAPPSAGAAARGAVTGGTARGGNKPARGECDWRRAARRAVCVIGGGGCNNSTRRARYVMRAMHGEPARRGCTECTAACRAPGGTAGRAFRRFPREARASVMILCSPMRETRSYRAAYSAPL